MWFIYSIYILNFFGRQSTLPFKKYIYVMMKNSPEWTRIDESDQTAVQCGLWSNQQVRLPDWWLINPTKYQATIGPDTTLCTNHMLSSIMHITQLKASTKWQCMPKLHFFKDKNSLKLTKFLTLYVNFFILSDSLHCQSATAWPSDFNLGS